LPGGSTKRGEGTNALKKGFTGNGRVVWNRKKTWAKKKISRKSVELIKTSAE